MKTPAKGLRKTAFVEEDGAGHDDASAAKAEVEHLQLRDRLALDERHTSWVALLRAHTRATERVARGVEGALPPDWFDVLMSLEAAPEGGLRVGALGERVALTRSGLTRLVDRIEAAGLIERRASSTDRRAQHVVLTEEGRAACKKNLPIYARAIAESFGSRYTEAEARELGRLLSRQVEEPSGS